MNNPQTQIQSSGGRPTTEFNTVARKVLAARDSNKVVPKGPLLKLVRQPSS